jgi:hypothetical protein
MRVGESHKQVLEGGGITQRFLRNEVQGRLFIASQRHGRRGWGVGDERALYFLMGGRSNKGSLGRDDDGRRQWSNSYCIRC